MDALSVAFETARAGNFELLDVALTQGPDLGARDTARVTVARHAAMEGLLPCLRHVLALAPALDLGPCLLWSVNNGHDEVVRFLLDKGADANARRDDGAAVLHVAACGDRAEIVRLLAGAGAALDALHQGWTPLIFAAQGGHLAATLALVEAGADRDIKTPKGNSAETLAREAKHYEVIPVLCGDPLLFRRESLALAKLRSAIENGDPEAAELAGDDIRELVSPLYVVKNKHLLGDRAKAMAELICQASERHLLPPAAAGRLLPELKFRLKDEEYDAFRVRVSQPCYDAISAALPSAVEQDLAQHCAELRELLLACGLAFFSTEQRQGWAALLDDALCRHPGAQRAILETVLFLNSSGPRAEALFAQFVGRIEVRELHGATCRMPDGVVRRVAKIAVVAHKGDVDPAQYFGAAAVLKDGCGNGISIREDPIPLCELSYHAEITEGVVGEPQFGFSKLVLAFNETDRYPRHPIGHSLAIESELRRQVVAQLAVARPAPDTVYQIPNFRIVTGEMLASDGHWDEYSFHVENAAGERIASGTYDSTCRGVEGQIYISRRGVVHLRVGCWALFEFDEAGAVSPRSEWSSSFDQDKVLVATCRSGAVTGSDWAAGA